MKKFICVLIAILMVVPLLGCEVIEKLDYILNNTVQQPKETETAAEPTATAEVTANPTSDPTSQVDANAAFAELDLEIFREFVCSSADTYNQYIVSDPAKFGIDPDDVTKGWGEMTYDAHVESMDYYREVLEKLDAIDVNSLSEKNRYAYAMLKRSMEVNLRYEDYYYYDEPLLPVNGTHTMLPLGLSCFNIRKLEDVESYLFLLEDMERLIGQIADFEDEKAAQGLFMTECALDDVIDSCRTFAQTGKDSFLIGVFDDILEKARSFGATDEQCAAFKARNDELVLEHILPAYSSLADRLEAHRKDCSPFVGAVERGEKAKAYFELSAMDEGATTDDIDTVLKLMESMGEGTYLDFCYAVIYGGDAVMEKYENGEEITFGSVEKNIEWLKGFVKQYYPDMPDYSLSFVEVPDEIADDFSPAAYMMPAFDDYYDNLMLINPSSEGSDDLLTTAHETLPGHMYQYLMARNDSGLSLAQQVLEPVGYAEAWTVFSEKFVASKCAETGINYNKLVNGEGTFFNIFIPAYISIQVNSKGWKLDDVKDYLAQYGVDSSADIFYEYAITMPNYAMSYAVGYSYLYDIVAKANPSTPNEYKAFFAKYLSFGPAYMDMIRDYMSK